MCGINKESDIVKFRAKFIIILDELENKKFLIDGNFNMKVWLEFSKKIKQFMVMRK